MEEDEMEEDFRHLDLTPQIVKLSKSLLEQDSHLQSLTPERMN